MNRISSRWFALFTLLGMVCGLALSVLIQPISAIAIAPTTTPTLSGRGVLLAGETPDTPNENEPIRIAQAENQSPEPANPASLATKAFTYQGMLRQNGIPVNATCDFQFSAWDALTAGTQIGGNQLVTSLIANGLFTVKLNNSSEFGDSVFDGRAVWIETAVRCPSGPGAYSTLSPRQSITAAPLASGLAPHTALDVGDTFSGYSAFRIHAPATTWGNPMALEARADNTEVLGFSRPVGVWGDSAAGNGILGTTNIGNGIYGLTLGNGNAIYGDSLGPGLAGKFNGDVTITGKLNSRMKITQVINSIGPLPLTSSGFTTSGGTLILFYSGSGYANSNQKSIGMAVYIDGNFVDWTGIFANNALTHLAFVPKQWVMAGIAAGSHTITLEPLDANTLSDYNDIFEVTVMEMPY